MVVDKNYQTASFLDGETCSYIYIYVCVVAKLLKTYSTFMPKISCGYITGYVIINTGDSSGAAARGKNNMIALLSLVAAITIVMS